MPIESEQEYDGAAKGFDEGYYAGECNAYSKVLTVLEELTI